MADALTQDVLQEIERIHQFFIPWFGGRVERTEANYAGFRGVIADDFWQVNPAGKFRPHEVIVADVWNAWGGQPGDPDYRIWVEKPAVRNVIGDLAIAVYEEWQTYKGVVIGRTCSAVLRRKAGLPHGVQWLQMHESLLPPPA
jgi:hypothetical protein